MKKIWIILLTSILLCFFSPSTKAQEGGSGYSRYGLGDIRYVTSSRAIGMGSAGIASLSTNSMNQMNPAAWVRINRTRYAAGARYEGYSISDGNQSTFLSGATFDGVTLSVPASVSSGIVFTAGIVPFSRVNYNIVSPDTQAGIDYLLQYLGKGGVSLGYFGTSASITGDLHIGAKLNYYVGTVQHSVKQTFASSAYTSSEVVRSDRLRGAGFTFGTVYGGLKKILDLSEDRTLDVGALLTTTSYLTASEERFYRYTTASLTSRDTTESSDGKIRLPYALGFGISYGTDRFLIAGDLYYQNWHRYTKNGIPDVELRDSYRFGIGAEILPKRDPSAPFTQRMSYQFGSFYQSSYYRIKNEPINEIGLTGGLELPIFGDTRLNIAGELSVRGTTKYGLQKDRILRISFTLSSSELWFVRPEEE